MNARQDSNDPFLQEHFEDFFEQALCGFLIADPQGIIIRGNEKLASWCGYTPNELTGKRFSDLLSIGGKIYYETHLWPLLRMQGFFDEVVLELNNTAGSKLRVMVNGMERRDATGKPLFIRYTILKATDRLQYEQNLQEARSIAEKELLTQKEMVSLREQLIAVLGHDLRNPLTAVSMAAALMETMSTDAELTVLIATIKRSSGRMTELVNNVMDFARTRLGGNLIINKQDIQLEPVLRQVVQELQLVFPSRVIIVTYDITEPVNCDPDRIAQLLSNLVANALTHGEVDTDVRIHVFHRDGILEIAVSNNGEPIPEALHEQLFSPFTREGSRPSRNGLGLGFFIASEIARAHNATLTFTSTEAETCFTFHMHTT